MTTEHEQKKLIVSASRSRLKDILFVMREMKGLLKSEDDKLVLTSATLLTCVHKYIFEQAAIDSAKIAEQMVEIDSATKH
jgi:hypothetical protein